jgi:hypothetical protein
MLEADVLATAALLRRIRRRLLRRTMQGGAFWRWIAKDVGEAAIFVEGFDMSQQEIIESLAAHGLDVISVEPSIYGCTFAVRRRL